MKRLALLLLISAACGKGGGNKEGNAARDGVIEAWKKGKLDPSAFTAATTDVGKDCATGTVNKVDVLLCVFPSDQEAKTAEDAGLKWVGDTTGTARAQGNVLIAVADRRKADPSGRTINQIVTLPAK